MITILLTGKNGQLGWELQRTLAPRGTVIALGRQDLNLADPDAIRKTIGEIKPAVIVNAAAYTAVDKAESEPELAMRINGYAPGILAEEAKKLDALFIHYSTDYVFDGAKSTPYTEDDSPSPINVYGKTKLIGEQAIQAVGGAYLIFRTGWVYANRGKNFLLTILRLSQERDELKIVNDQFGAPTWSRLIGDATAQILAQLYAPCTPRASPITHYSSLITDLRGIYHMTAGGQTTWFGFAQAILENRIPAPRLTAIPSSEYPLPARRPANSVLFNAKLGSAFGITLPDWRENLRLCREESLPFTS